MHLWIIQLLLLSEPIDNSMLQYVILLSEALDNGETSSKGESMSSALVWRLTHGTGVLVHTHLKCL